MEINWTQLLDQIQDLRAHLETWGVTYEILFGLGAAAFALFLISLREIVVWYLRISQLHAQMQQLSRQLSQIQSSVDQVQTSRPEKPVFEESLPREREDEAEMASAGARKKFSLDH
jgi:hypothetical protein